jgi:hypothetical protein
MKSKTLVLVGAVVLTVGIIVLFSGGDPVRLYVLAAADFALASYLRQGEG